MSDAKALTIDELQVGMYVIDIILKDSQHKVKNQGKVNSPKTIALLKKQGVAKVIIDLDKSSDEAIAKLKQACDQDLSAEAFEQSVALYEQATESVKETFLQVKAGQKLDLKNIHKLAAEITESVSKNEYAMTILTRIRQQSTYQWEHSLNTAVLMCGFALFLGLKEEIVKEITLGALLHDVGNAKVPNVILEKPDSLTKNELDLVKKHAMWGLQICKQEGLSSSIITDMTINHHERLDGSGYPRGIEKGKLSKLARMIAIVDVYDAMTGDKSYKIGRQPVDCLRYLLSKKDKFDQGIVQQFIKYIGVHPVGSLVMLSNEKLAMVTQGNRVNPIKPKVHVIFNLTTQRYTKPKEVDLMEEDISIVSSIRSDDYDINANKIIEQLFT